MKKNENARLITLLATLALALSFVGCSDSDDEIFVATLSPGNEVLPVSSGASGSAGFTVQGDTIHYSVSTGDIDAVTGAHIHTGPAGSNGGILVVLFPGPGQPPFTDPTGQLEGFLTRGSFAASAVDGVSFEELLAQMRAGTAYVNVHTTAYGAGEIRGQIQPAR